MPGGSRGARKWRRDGTEKDGYLNPETLDTRDKYGAFLWGNNGLTILKSDREVTGEPSRVLVIRDSYANCFAPFLALQYDEVWIADLRSLAKGLPEDVKETDFTDILVLYNFMNLASDNNFYRLSY